MLGVERREFIYKLLLERGSITVSELSRLCQIGEETIRRDLNKMAAAGRVEKIYGGACIRETMHRVLPVATRKVLNVDAKKQIAACCRDMVEEGDTIFLDGSTTALQIAESLSSFQSLIVISNSLEVAYSLANAPGVKVIGIGGTMRNNTKTFVGHSSVAAIEEYYADKCFICCDGADLDAGITDAHEQEAEVRKTMIRHSRVHVLTADSTKFNRVSFARITAWKDIDRVVTDLEPDSRWLQFFEELSIHCEFCDSGTGEG